MRLPAHTWPPPHLRFAHVCADARPTALLALASHALVLADARPAALLAAASFARVLAKAQRIAAGLEPAYVSIRQAYHTSAYV
jgi:hypothetical protein